MKATSDSPAIKKARIVKRVQASYDSAQTTRLNREQWKWADALSANAANDPATRAILRNRSRYEVANNSWAKGMMLSLANFMVGTGPRLQLLTDNPVLNRRAEALWRQHCRKIGLAAKLRTMRMAKATDGEVFAILTLNPRHGDILNADLRLVEPELCATPHSQYTAYTPDETVDGIEHDEHDNPVAYHFLKQHPGGTGFSANTETTRLPASRVIHWFRADRPGAHRAIPEITAALENFGLLRRYSLAVVDAAEQAAAFGGIIRAEAGGEGPDDLVDYEEFDEVDFSRRSWPILPKGYDIAQFKAEQPLSVYDAYVCSKLNEIAACLPMTLAIAMCNSSGYNYSSGRLDHQTFFRAIRIEQDDCERVALEPLFALWLRQLVLTSEFAAWRNLSPETLAHSWFWDGVGHVDPTKEATGAKLRIETGLSNLSVECAREGHDAEEVMRQAIREKFAKVQIARELAQEYDLDEEQAVQIATTPTPTTVNVGSDDTDKSNQDEDEK